MDMSRPEDIPPGVDFLSEEAARKWAEEAAAKLASRMDFFDAFLKAITAHVPIVRSVCELGSGPGFLAEYILSRCPAVEQYSLLDFSSHMLAMSRERLEAFNGRVSFLHVDFKQSGWVDKVDKIYDCIATIQAVHELRHKRHAPQFYKECSCILDKGGILLVCDRLPQDDSEHDRALFMTENEQLAALRQAGFSNTEILLQTSERVACRAIKL
jgi:ubiquinone/menaquinone biosynthesis C-methylase UbiE